MKRQQHFCNHWCILYDRAGCAISSFLKIEFFFSPQVGILPRSLVQGLGLTKNSDGIYGNSLNLIGLYRDEIFPDLGPDAGTMANRPPSSCHLHQSPLGYPEAASVWLHIFPEQLISSDKARWNINFRPVWHMVGHV